MTSGTTWFVCSRHALNGKANIGSPATDASTTAPRGSGARLFATGGKTSPAYTRSSAGLCEIVSALAAANSIAARTRDSCPAETTIPPTSPRPSGPDAASVYSPAARSLNAYLPPREVIDPTAAPVAAFRSVKVTFSSGSEWLSVSWPVSEPVSRCAPAQDVENASATARTSTAQGRIRNCNPMRTLLAARGQALPKASFLPDREIRSHARQNGNSTQTARRFSLQ